MAVLSITNRITTNTSFKTGSLALTLGLLLTGCGNLKVVSSSGNTIYSNEAESEPQQSNSTSPYYASHSTYDESDNEGASEHLDPRVTEIEAQTQRVIPVLDTSIYQGPKALNDMQAFNIEMNRGREERKITSTASGVFVSHKNQPSVKRTPRGEAVTGLQKVNVPTPPTPSTAPSGKLVNKPVKTVAPSQNQMLAEMKKRASAPVKEVKPETVAAASNPKAAEKVSTSNINSVAQVNRLIEEQPTAAGEQTIALLDTPKPSKPATKEISREATPVKPKQAKKPLVKQEAQRTKVGGSGFWHVEKNWDSAHPDSCRISTPTIQIDEDGYATQVWFDVVDGKLLVNASTNIDINMNGVGIKAGKGAVEKFSKNELAGTAVWSGNLQKTLSKNSTMTVILGGNELGKRRHEASIDLTDLRKAYPAYLKCR